MKVLAMSMTRSQFESKPNEFLNGGFGEFYLARMAELMGWPTYTYVGKWDREANRLIAKELSRFFSTQETKTNFDRHKLLYSCLAEIKEKDLKWLAFGTNYLLKVARNKKLPIKFKKSEYDFDKWYADFSAMVDLAIGGG